MLTEAMKIGKCYIPETGFENERKIEYIFWEMWSFFHGLFFKILFENNLAKNLCSDSIQIICQGPDT